MTISVKRNTFFGQATHIHIHIAKLQGDSETTSFSQRGQSGYTQSLQEYNNGQLMTYIVTKLMNDQNIFSAPWVFTLFFIL